MDLSKNSNENKNETEEKKRRNLSWRTVICEVLLDFTKNTTLHGLRYAAERGLSIVERIFWIIIFLLSFSMCVLIIQGVWVKWQTNQPFVTFSERLTYVSEIPFPAVTICPHQKINQTLYNYTKMCTHYRDNWNKTPELELKKAVNEIAWIRLVCSDYLGHTRWIRKLINYSYEDHNSVLNLVKVAPKLEDIFYSSAVFGKQIRDLHRYYSQVLTEEGVCYTFNSLPVDQILNIDKVQKNYTYLNKSTTARNNKALRNGSYSSRDHLLLGRILKAAIARIPEYRDRSFVMLSMNRYNCHNRHAWQRNSFLPDVIMKLRQLHNRDNLCDGNEPGFKIYLHHPGDLPQSSMYYYPVIPDHVNSLAISVDMLQASDSLYRCPPHIRQCYFPGEKKLKYYRVYSEKNCRLECFTNYTLEMCDCVWFHMPHNDSTMLCRFVDKFCLDIGFGLLISDAPANKESAYQQCKCLPSCDSIQYKAEVLRKLAPFRNKQNQTEINIYFKESTFVSRARECSGMFEFTDFLAYCGGILGLFLGFSFLSLFEVFYFCTLRFCCAFRRQYQNKREKSTDADTEKISKLPTIS